MSISSARENFWSQASFVVIGHGAKAPFPRLTYRGLKSLGKVVYPVDESASTVEGDAAFRDLASLPTKVEAAVLELPEAETAAWVERAAQAGIRRLWLHEGTETPAALETAKRLGVELLTGRCAVMYVSPREFPHNFHRWILQRLGRY